MKWVLSLALLCGTVTPVASMNLDDKAGMEEVNKRFYDSGNELVGYEEWNEDDGKKWVMTWKIPQEYDGEIQYN